MDMKKLISIVDNSGTKEKTVITEGTNMAQQMVMQQYSKPQQTAPKFKSRINEYFKVVDNEMLNVLKEEQAQKKIQVKKIVNRVLTRMDEGKTVKAEAPKPRNFVAKNATTSGAGAHKDKKKADKQGDVKHKSKALELAELRTEVKDKDGKVTSWKDEGEWKKSTANKDGRGKVTNLSDKARRETETLSKKEKDVAESKQRMSRAAKGNEKYGKDGMKALAKAGREGAGEKKLDVIRDKHDKYDKDVSEAAKKGLYYNVNKRKAAGTSRNASHPKAPTAQAWKDAAKTAKKESVRESYGSVEVGAPVKVYSNVLKKAVFGKVVKLSEGRAYVQYDNTKIVMGHPIETVQLNEAAATAAGAQIAAKTGGKLASRLIPGLGFAAGAYDAYDRVKKGDYVGAGLSGLGAVTSFIPGIGTAATLGLTGAQLARDYKKKTGAFAPGEADAANQAATPATAPGAMTPNPKTPATAAAVPSIKDPMALQKALIAAGANLGPTGADGDIGKLTKAAIADPKYAEIVKKYATAPTQTATPDANSGSPIAAAARTVAPAAAAVARQALTR